MGQNLPATCPWLCGDQEGVRSWAPAQGAPQEPDTLHNSSWPTSVGILGCPLRRGPDVLSAPVEDLQLHTNPSGPILPPPLPYFCLWLSKALPL